MDLRITNAPLYQLSYTGKKRVCEADLKASARTRTVDLRITNAPLYQLSYTGICP